MLGILGLLELIIGAGILGIIIAVMEEGEFPGWSPIIVCLLAASIPAAIVNAVLPPNSFFVGLAVGAVCAGFAISAMCGMSVKTPEKNDLPDFIRAEIQRARARPRRSVRLCGRSALGAIGRSSTNRGSGIDPALTGQGRVGGSWFCRFGRGCGS